MVPAQIGADDLAVVGVVDALQASGPPTLEGGEVLVTGGEHAVGDEHVAQVLTAQPRCERVDAGVAERHLAGDDRPQSGDDIGDGEPADAVDRARHGAPRIVERDESNVDPSVSVIEDRRAALAQIAAQAQVAPCSGVCLRRFIVVWSSSPAWGIGFAQRMDQLTGTRSGREVHRCPRADDPAVHPPRNAHRHPTGEELADHPGCTRRLPRHARRAGNEGQRRTPRPRPPTLE